VSETAARGPVGRRRKLRTRLLVAMATIAVGVVVVTGVTTVALARRSAQRSAISNLEDQAPDVRAQLLQLGRVLRGRELRGQPTAPVGRLVTSVLRVTGGTLLTVHADGTITEGVDALAAGAVGTDRPIASTRAAARAARRNRLRNRLGLAPTSSSTLTSAPGASATEVPNVNGLPAGLTLEDFDARALFAGERQTGTANGRVFVAEPVRAGVDAVPVLVLTERIDSAALSRARGFFLIGAVLALVAAGVVSYFLARRLTRPLAAMGTTAGAIAGGDLTARVDLGRHPDDELADLGRALNAMAAELEVARHGERQFLLSVSHDLRTPLTSIRGYADALTDGTIPATDEQRRAAVVIAAEAGRLERLVADLLDLARIDAHQFSLSPRPFDVAATVRTAVEAFLPAATDLGIELVAVVPSELAAVGDPDRVAQIVANLVENALKYAQRRITVTVAADGLHEVAIRVVDDGPGIDPGEEQRVFERLYVSRTSPGRSVGTGLGLAIVGELATAMGGTAAVEPTFAAGATFLVRLPLPA
jgi:signal transduction histidine kinase